MNQPETLHRMAPYQIAVPTVRRTRRNRAAHKAVLFAYAACGWVGLVGIAYLLATAL